MAHQPFISPVMFYCAPLSSVHNKLYKAQCEVENEINNKNTRFILATEEIYAYRCIYKKKKTFHIQYTNNKGYIVEFVSVEQLVQLIKYTNGSFRIRRTVSRFNDII